MVASEDLLVNAFAKFLAADLSIDRAGFGLFGIIDQLMNTILQHANFQMIHYHTIACYHVAS